MQSFKSLSTLITLSLTTVLALSPAQAKPKHAADKPASAEAVKSEPAENTPSHWRQLESRTNPNGNTLEVWVGHDDVKTRDVKKITDRFILVKRDKRGVASEIVLGKLPRRQDNSKPVEFAELATRGTIVTTMTLGPAGDKVAKNIVPAKQAGNRKKWQPTPKQFAALNHLFNTIARSQAALKPEQASSNAAAKESGPTERKDGK